MLRFLLLLIPTLLWAQLVIKHHGQISDALFDYYSRSPWTDNLDVDGDGVNEVFMGPYNDSAGVGFLNVITGEAYLVFDYPANGWQEDWHSCRVAVGKSRDQLHAEVFIDDRVYDIATGELLYSVQEFDEIHKIVSRDYDGDGLDDFFVFNRLGDGSILYCYEFLVIGSGSAYIPSVGPTLDIQAIGPDMHLQWESVAAADGYRILWGADPDSPCFTQVGYTQSTSFLHTGFGDVPKGFYKVIAVSAEGVPRGQSMTAGLAGKGGSR